MTENITPRNSKDLRLCIQAFNEQYSDAAYSFAHIVLGDNNLDDHCILYCLEETTIAHWENDWKKLYAEDIGPDANPFYAQYILEKLEKQKHATIAFLRWLLMVPEYIRDEAKEEEYDD